MIFAIGSWLYTQGMIRSMAVLLWKKKTDKDFKWKGEKRFRK